MPAVVILANVALPLADNALVPALNVNPALAPALPLAL